MTDEQQTALITAINAMPAQLTPGDIILFILNVFSSYGFDDEEAWKCALGLALAVHGGAYAEVRERGRAPEKMN